MTPELFDRRAVLPAGAGAGAALGLAVPGALASCGGGDKLNAHTKAVARHSIAIDDASFYAPIDDVRRLVSERAHKRRALITFSKDPAGAGAQVRSLRTLTGKRGGFRVVVSYVTPLRSQTAAITVDPARTGALLAANAARWARRELRGRSAVLLVVPPTGQTVPDPFAAGAARSEPAIRSTLAARAPGLRVAGTVSARNGPAKNVAPPIHVLTPASGALRSFEGDYAEKGSATP
ncbi:MAG: hypothetical protein QOG15_1580 [Solirubrobacteraceae bacterium]|jgi:hypothetical protein|nr:hypothetical protein [Solirubrobacteraceae bacterium]